ncbi:flagellar basal body P-ring formation protein FlgA [bacterium]|nr:flagellar basal body P-ring formation protein FlgA [bacterium]
MSRRFRFTTCLTLTCLAFAAQADGAIIRLRRTAEVDSSLIRLGDIAEVYSNSDETDAELSELMIAPAPLAGTQIHLLAREIQAKLADRGQAVGALDFEGSSVVLVSRKPELSKSPAPKIILPGPNNRPVQQKPAEPLHRSVRLASISNISPRDFSTAQSIVEEAVQDYLDQMAPGWGNPRIQAQLSTGDAPQVLKMRGRPQILSGQQLDDQHFLLTLSIPEAGAKISHLNVKVRIIRRPKVFAPSRMIARGEIIRPEDLTEIETDDAGNGVADAGLLIGMEAAQPLRTGTPVRLAHVRPPLLIRNRETVQVISECGNVRVRQFFTARQDGRRGETILLEALDGKRTIPATVTGRQQALISNADSSSPPAGSESAAGVQLTVLNQ